MVPCSAKENVGEYVKDLKTMLLKKLSVPQRSNEGKFTILIDHCFKIKGKGTILTGTVTSGKAKPGD